MSVLINSDAPPSAMTANATSETTSAARVEREPRSAFPIVLRDPPLSAAMAPTRDARAIGANPNKIPVSTQTAAANARAPVSSPISPTRGIDSGAAATIIRSAGQEARIPSTPPPTVNTAVSSVSCAAIRRRDAPSAERIINSRRRTSPRPSMRLATFTQAMRRTSPTAPSKAMRYCCAPPTTRSRIGLTSTRSGSDFE